MHCSDVLGGRERAEVDSEHRLRVLALEGVRGPGKSPAQTHLNARHGSQEPNNRAGAAQDDGAAQARYRQRGDSRHVQKLPRSISAPSGGVGIERHHEVVSSDRVARSG